MAPSPRLGRQARLWLFITALWAFAGVVAFAQLTHLHSPGSQRIPWWALAIFFYLAETNVVHLHFRREAHTLSLNELPLVVGLFFTPPEQVVMAIVLGSAAALVFHRRQPLVKLAFNIGQFAVSSSVAILVFHLVGSGRIDRPHYWLAALAAVTLAALSSIAMVTLAIFLADGSNTLGSIPRIAIIALTGAYANASLALLVVEVLHENTPGLVLLLLPSAAAVFAFCAYTRQTQRHEHLTHLYETMQATHTSAEVDGAVRELLASSRRIFRADLAELVLKVPERGEVLRSTLAPNGQLLMRPSQLQPEEAPFIEGRELGDGAVLMGRSTRGRSAHPYLVSRGFRDAMIAPLSGEERVVGMLVVADRTSDVTSFTPDDRRLFQAFAAHAGILLDNDGKLRHQAFHDALTGLPNRRMILHETTAALENRGEGRPALLFLDLDDFKTVNDSLGHSAGDKLLAAVAERLKEAIGPGDTAARLGGDEFAILLRNASPADAEATAARLLERFAVPFGFGLDEITVHPTVGIAVAGHDMRDAEDLLRNADLAMYSVKGESKQRFAAYQPEMHLRVRKRHELIARLERAVEMDGIKVHYQPVIELATGQLAAFEALVRWKSDDGEGLLSPAEFLPAAEETGLIIPIGKVVLEQAVRQLRSWQATHMLGPEVAMAVNLSAREIHDVALPARVDELLRSTGLHPRSLILELTEHSAIIDFDSTLETLRELRKLGVLVALDDFGTGHSSLSHLWELPIDLIKIGSPFTDRVGDGGTPLARAVFNFAGSLPLGIVAENIETADQAAALAGLRCTYGQGFYFAPPLNAADADRYIRSGKRSRRVDAA